MKKLLIFILSFFLFIQVSTLADNNVLIEEKTQVTEPKWEEYAPQKYVNPRTDFRMGSAIAELVSGIFLTDLIFTAPIGIPLIYHSATKIKNISYANKKEIFEDGLEYAKTIDNEKEKEKYYKKLIKKCKLSEKKRQKILKKKLKNKI